MKAQGILLLGQSRPVIGRTLDGGFELTLIATDHSHPAGAEPWCIRWPGEAAQRFWDKCAPRLQPGQPMHVELAQLHCKPRGRHGPMIEAVAQAVVLLPRLESVKA